MAEQAQFDFCALFVDYSARGGMTQNYKTDGVRMRADTAK